MILCKLLHHFSFTKDPTQSVQIEDCFFSLRPKDGCWMTLTPRDGWLLYLQFSFIWMCFDKCAILIFIYDKTDLGTEKREKKSKRPGHQGKVPFAIWKFKKGGGMVYNYVSDFFFLSNLGSYKKNEEWEVLESTLKYVESLLTCRNLSYIIVFFIILPRTRNNLESVPWKVPYHVCFTSHYDFKGRY